MRAIRTRCLGREDGADNEMGPLTENNKRQKITKKVAYCMFGQSKISFFLIKSYEVKIRHGAS